MPSCAPENFSFLVLPPPRTAQIRTPARRCHATAPGRTGSLCGSRFGLTSLGRGVRLPSRVDRFAPQTPSLNMRKV